MIRRIVLFPPPDGPRRATSSFGRTSNDTSETTGVSPNFLCSRTTRIPISCLLAALEHDEQRGRDRGEHERHAVGRARLSLLEGDVDERGRGLGLPRDRAPEDEDGAELAERTGDGEGGADRQPVP